jgi:hypothetical protein
MRSDLPARASRRRPAPSIPGYRPRAARGLVVEPHDGGCVIRQPRRERAHQLNPTASLVFALCTGRTSEEQIVGLVKEAYRLRHRPVDEVRRLLARFEDEGLVVSGRWWRRAEGRAVPEFDVVVVANRHRAPIVVPHLGDYRYAVSYTRDYRLPRDYSAPHPELQALGPWNGVGMLRCYLGHRDAIRLAEGDAILVLEDDAVPNRPDWMALARRASPLLREFEVVALHARDVVGVDRVWSSDGLTFYTLAPVTVSRNGTTSRLRFALGAALAYLIRRSSARELFRRTFDAYPIDLLLVNHFRAAILRDSPFDHDRSQGSLTENPK